MFTTHVVEAFHSMTLSTTVSAILLLWTSYQSCIWIYNAYLHPLAKIPGPRIWATSRIPHELYLARGDLHRKLRDLHEKYGNIVRVSPSGLSFIHPDAWTDIMVKSEPGARIPVKDMMRFTDALKVNGAPEMLTADDKTHSRQRRLLSHAFSENVLKTKSQKLIQGHLDNLIEQLRKRTGQSIDITKWTSLFTFDVIGDLAFGEPFGCLIKGDYHPWTRLIFESVYAVTILGSLRQFPWLHSAIDWAISGYMRRVLLEHQDFCTRAVSHRLSKQSDRGDFLSEIMKHNGTEKEMTTEEIMSNCNLLVPAGSESVTEVIVSMIHYITRSDEVYKRLVKEVRSSFKKESDITFEASENLKYLQACIYESMRLHPPVSIHNPRRGPSEGAMIQGVWVTNEMTLGVYHWPAYRSSANFKNADTFEPSRWLGNPIYASDRRKVLNPFGFGARNCIGKHLALSEIRFVICRILFCFDLISNMGDDDWAERKSWWTWGKKSLWITLTPRA